MYRDKRLASYYRLPTLLLKPLTTATGIEEADLLSYIDRECASMSKFINVGQYIKTIKSFTKALSLQLYRYSFYILFKKMFVVGVGGQGWLRY